jgi:hypothetical protein
MAALTFVLAPLSLLVSGCAEDDAQFSVKYAPEFQKGTISVVGVFREGRMSPETWDDIGPRLSAVFGKTSCPVAYDTKLLTTKAELAESIDDYARENGVTDDLLDQLAPAANGDMMLVITVAGRPPKAAKDPGIQGPPPTAQAPGSPRSTGMGGMGGARHGGGMGNPSPMRMPAVDRNAYELSASLFSLKDHHTIALVTMGYSGPSTDVALARFTEKLRTSLAGFPCVGWNMDAPLDAKKIKELRSE